MNSESILIVDDNQSNLRLLEAVLDNGHYGVRTAGDAEEALKLLRSWRPRLILMDLQLPGIDGLELTRRLKRDPRYKDIIIVALTAYAMKGDEQKARTAGCDGYVTKPIDIRSLPEMIARLLKARDRAEPRQLVPAAAAQKRNA